MKNLTFALACASTFALFAAIDVPKADFEGYEAGAKVSASDMPEPGTQLKYWLYDGTSGSEDGSTVTAYAPAESDQNQKYLNLSTEGGTLWRSLAKVNTEGSGTLGDAQDIPDAGLYIDTMVQFTPTEDGEPPKTDEGDKLAIWLNVDTKGEAPVTNLCVKARQVSGTDCDGSVDPLGTIYKITNVVPQPGTWYRLTVKAVSDLTSYGLFGGFQIFLDNTVLVADKRTVDEDAYGTLSGDTSYCSTEKLALITEKKVFASLVDLTGLQAVGFKGSGALDNLSISEENPLPAPGATIDFTITAGANTTVEWSKDGETWTEYVTGAQAAAGTLYVRLTNADGATKVLTKELSSNSNSFDVSTETFGWPEYLGAAIDGAYVINDEAELVRFQKGVATLGSKGVTFKLGADIALTESWPGIGVAKAKDMVSWALEGDGAITREDADARVAAFTADKGGAFQGVFDGGSHTVSNVKFVRGDYAGFFQSCYGSTIKNLKIELAGDGWEASDVTVFGGGGIAGVVVDTTIENCEASGTFTGSKGVGGIVGYAGSGAVLKGCVNKAAVTSTGNEKAGGLIACAQNGNPDMGANGVVVDGCQNLGNVSSEKADSSRASGLVSYTDSKVTFKGHNVFGGTVAAPGGVQSIINLNGGSMVVADDATFTVPAAYKTVNKNAVDGVFYATVADGVATLVKNAKAVAGANLKVMADGAPDVVLANVGDTITLDTTLATVTVTTTAENAEVQQKDNVYTVVAKTVAVEKVTLNQETAEITVGGKALTLTATVTPENATDKTVKWTSSDDTKATVENGVVTAVAAGVVTITATAGDKSATCTVTVKAASYPTYIGEDAAKQAKYDAWVKTYGVSDTGSAYMDAYLLNCAPEDVDTEKAKFKIVSFEQDAKTGAWIVKVTDGNKVDGDDYGNGTIEIQGATTLDGPWAKDTPGAKFFKAILK